MPRSQQAIAYHPLWVTSMMIPCKKCIVCAIGRVFLNSDQPVEKKLQDIVDILTSNFNAQRCSIMLINSNGLTIEVRAANNPAIIGLTRRLSDVTIATRALLDNGPFTADEKRRSYFTPLESSTYISEYSLSIPITHLNKKLGVINLAGVTNGDRLAYEHEKILQEVVEHLAPYIYAIQSKEFCELKIKRLTEANERLLQLDELKTNLVNFMVHDLKCPISTIMANLDMLSYEELTTDQFECLNLAIEDIYKMQRMVMNILDVQKLEEGKVKIYREEIDIYDLAKREAASFKTVLFRRNIELLVKGDPHLCYIDENLIGRTIANLLMNATEHSPDNKKIVLEVRHDLVKQEVKVCITDQGISVPDELKKKIFDKFFQIGEEKKQRKTTTGLGLAFCMLVVRAHGGELWTEDSADGGALFCFTLPETLKEIIR